MIDLTMKAIPVCKLKGRSNNVKNEIADIYMKHKKINRFEFQFVP